MARTQNVAATFFGAKNVDAFPGANGGSGSAAPRTASPRRSPFNRPFRTGWQTVITQHRYALALQMPPELAFLLPRRFPLVVHMSTRSPFSMFHLTMKEAEDDGSGGTGALSTVALPRNVFLVPVCRLLFLVAHSVRVGKPSGPYPTSTPDRRPSAVKKKGCTNRGNKRYSG